MSQCEETFNLFSFETNAKFKQMIKNISIKFGAEHCKVLENKGNIPVIIRITFPGYSARIQLLWKDDTSLAQMLICYENGDYVDVTDTLDLCQPVDDTYYDLIFQSILTAWQQMIVENYADSVENSAMNANSSTQSLHSKNKSSKKPASISQVEIDKKSSMRMRTALDVINRILWDDSLPSEEFYVGYIDRFLGIIEKPFNEFYWGDYVDADIDCLAVPQHRIRRFKFREEVVWDRDERKDLIFGNQNGRTIYDLINELNMLKDGENTHIAVE